MTEGHRKLRDEMKKRIKAAVQDGPTNVAKTVNVGGKGKRTSVSSRQRVVQRDGVTTKVTETSRNESYE